MDYGTHLLIVWTAIIGFSLVTVIIGWIAASTDSALGVVLTILFAIGTIGAGIAANVSTYRSSAAHTTLTITKEERVTDTDGKTSRYLVYTPGETFENTDAMLSFGKTNSSDLYGQLAAGHTYSCLVAGWRVHFFSMYRNLISCQETK